MKHFTFSAANLDETARLATAVATHLPGGSVIALNGPLGAGKTAFVRAVATACGIDPREVTSPTFVLLQTYRGRRVVHHLDAYRLDSEDAFWDLGGDETFRAHDITIIEWADRIPGVLPPDSVTIEIASAPDGTRRFSVASVDAKFIDAIADSAGSGSDP